MPMCVPNQSYIIMDDKDAKIEQLEQKVAELESRIKELEAKPE